MTSHEDRRSAPRIQLTPKVSGGLSYFPISVVDLSVTGARLQHEPALMYAPGKRFVLEFTCDAQQFRITCEVARSRMDVSPATRKLVYTTGVRFVDVDQLTLARLWAVVAFRGGCDMVTQAASATGFPIPSH
ncbi:MAG TPA: PilZ domain-containing protein [Thermoanaerobaculia bacterium]|nr:PilZ domain-containing protein [Thermoanaerobaculia bacterium]